MTIHALGILLCLRHILEPGERGRVAVPRRRKHGQTVRPGNEPARSRIQVHSVARGAGVDPPKRDLQGLLSAGGPSDIEAQAPVLARHRARATVLPRPAEAHQRAEQKRGGPATVLRPIPAKGTGRSATITLPTRAPWRLAMSLPGWATCWHDRGPVRRPLDSTRLHNADAATGAEQPAERHVVPRDRLAEVAIVGGGVIGASIAAHLAERKVGRVVVFEREDALGDRVHREGRRRRASAVHHGGERGSLPVFDGGDSQLQGTDRGGRRLRPGRIPVPAGLRGGPGAVLGRWRSCSGNWGRRWR